MLQNNLQQIVPVQIVNDSVSGEPDQEYDLSLSEEPSDVEVTPYRLTTIVIEDLDGKIYILVYSQSNYFIIRSKPVRIWQNQKTIQEFCTEREITSVVLVN